MIKKYFNFILLFFLTVNLFGQDTIFFNSKWEETDAKNAKFYRIDLKTEVGFIRTDYFASNNQVQMTGKYLSLNPEIKTGEFNWYYENGSLKHKGEYTDDKEIGTHKWYFDNGKIEAIENYSDGNLNGEYKEFYKNGNLSSEAFFIDGLQNGFTKYYREDGSLHSEGQLKNGDRDGIWKYYDENGNIIGEKEYKTDYLIEEAKMAIQFPSTKWILTNKTSGDMTVYTFKREEITDNKGRQIIPAVMISIEDASDFESLIVYSIIKQKPFSKKGVKIDKVLTYENEGYPISYNNSLWYKCHYTEENFDHILYMIHIINNDNIGIQIFMDMTKEIADEYESEFIEILKTIKEQ
ncbi:MAG: toxin-antitoxin system YwqK family antitoxin [Bacteroidales bacterium]|nr:toxin-antitoxin system YwqK family antitoxin [Bacteroidales bacterium]